MSGGVVTVAGERFPRGWAPGDPVEWSEGEARRTGAVVDRAANGVSQGIEEAGYWLWVIPDDASDPVRVRTWASGRRKGEAFRDDGPMWARSNIGAGGIVRPNNDDPRRRIGAGGRVPTDE